MTFYPTRDDLVTFVRSFVGHSIDRDPEGELARLVDFPGGPPPEVEVRIKTNCAMFVLGVWRHYGCGSSYLSHPYVSGMALTWVLEIARDAHALHLPHDGFLPGPGDVIHYATKPRPGVPVVHDDHVEFALTVPNAARMFLHAGAGRANNAVTEHKGLDDYTVNNWRPLRHWVDTLKVLQHAY